MKKKTALLCSIIMLLTTACGSIDNSSEADEKITTASEEETTTEAEATEEVSTEAASEEFDMLGAELIIYPDLKLGMTEEEVQAIIGDNYERRVESLPIGDIIYYSVPFENYPFLDVDMEGIVLLTFLESNELIRVSCHFGVSDMDGTSTKEHSEKELRTVYDQLFSLTQRYFGNDYICNQKVENTLENVNWETEFGNYNLNCFYYPDTNTGKVSFSLSVNDSMQKIPADEKENARNSETAPNNVNILSQLDTGMTEEEVFSVIGRNYDHKYDDGYKPSLEYDYSFSSDEVFGTELNGYMFVEFDSKTQELICCGYHIGAVGNAEKAVYPYSEDMLANGYDKIIEKLISEYGEGQRPVDYTGEGVKSEMSWNDGSDQLWAIYGTNLWSKESGVNEIIVSRSIER